MPMLQRPKKILIFAISMLVLSVLAVIASFRANRTDSEFSITKNIRSLFSGVATTRADVPPIGGDGGGDGSDAGDCGDADAGDCGP